MYIKLLWKLEQKEKSTQRKERRIKEIKEALTEIKKIEEREKETQRLREKFREEKEKLEEKLK